jgi:hypothetical protein
MQNDTFDPVIIWEKWIDPFGADIEEAKWNDYDDEDKEISFQSEYIKQNSNPPIKVIASPVGLIPYNEYSASGKIFNFWVAHTNFNLSKEIASILEDINGIEILDVFTRYRFRVGIGKCFKEQEVMKNIKEEVNKFFDKPIFYE